jgi:hypothetical protein
MPIKRRIVVDLEDLNKKFAMIQKASKDRDPCPFMKFVKPNLRKKEHLYFAPTALELKHKVPRCSLPPTHLCNLKSCFDPEIWVKCRKVLGVADLHRRIMEKALETPFERIELKGAQKPDELSRNPH